MTSQVAGYLDVMPNRFLEEVHAKENCRGHWVSWGCDCKRKPAWADGCGRRNCPHCGKARSARQSCAVVERFIVGDSDRVQALVLTVPPLYRAQFAGRAGREQWRGALREFWSWLQSSRRAVFGYVRSHPCGDDGKKFHPHANWLFVEGVGVKGKLDVDCARLVWAMIVGGDELVDDRGRGLVDVHVGFYRLSGKGRYGMPGFMHKVRYIERPFPGWAWAGQRSRWFGSYPRGFEKIKMGHAGEVCPDCGVEPYLAELTPEERELMTERFMAGTLEGWSRKRDGVFR